MSVAAVMLVRDEADIIERTVTHLLGQVDGEQDDGRADGDGSLGLGRSRHGDDLAISYADLLVAHATDEWNGWPALHLAIIDRWSESALVYIKREAWRIVHWRRRVERARVTATGERRS